jgi:6-phosphofructokinase 2
MTSPALQTDNTRDQGGCSTLTILTMAYTLTLTMNPALDISTSADHIVPTHKLRCSAALVHAGGGGVNVARVLHRFGAPVRALFPAGGVTGQSLVQLLDGEGIATQPVLIDGETRESFSALDRSHGQEYRFVLPGPTLQAHEWQACLDALKAALQAPEHPNHVVASGSLPPGAPVDFYARVAALCKEASTTLALDTSGEPLQAALAHGVDIIKPSLRELQDLTGLPLDTTAQCLHAARQIIRQGQAAMVALSLGERGAMLITGTQAWQADALPVTVKSTIGAGDSFLAGLLWGLGHGLTLPESFCRAMAFGAAALLQEGTSLASPQDVERLLPQVQWRPEQEDA